MKDLFAKVNDAIEDAHLVAFDGCHKIYLAMDEIEAKWFRENYEITVEGGADRMLEAVLQWWEDSCSLRFVSGVYHNEANPNAGFIDLIPQFADEDEEEDELV